MASETKTGARKRPARRKSSSKPASSRTDVQAAAPELDTNGLETWLWDAACSIRGAVDAPKFKDYILPLVFLKRLSDVFDDEVDRLAEKFGDQETALELVEDDPSLVRFYLPEGAAWSEIRKLSKNIGQRLTEVVRATAKANPSLQGVIDVVDFNATISGQRIIEDGRLSKLVEILSRHRLGLRDVEPDVLGRAYEYLLRKFAEGQGQSAGEFFTPREVGWLIARLLDPAEGMSIYDPACGSGGLLVKEQLVLHQKIKGAKRPLQLFGQELNHVTYAIARMNMIVHDMEGQIAIGDTLRTPKFLQGSRLQHFDLVAANPMWNQDGYDTEFYDADSYDRFGSGPPPASTADWGWVQHINSSLTDRGRAVIVLDTGAVARGSGGRGTNRERDIRKEFVENDLVEGVVLLPENLFYNTTAPGILLCLNRDKPSGRAGQVILINASAEFAKGRPKNYLTEDGISRIVAAFSGGGDVDLLAKVVDRDEIADNDYNLSPSRYISAQADAPAIELEDALSSLKAAEAERAAADRDLQAVIKELGL
jgi:type I restriction enzyme M protein